MRKIALAVLMIFLAAAAMAQNDEGMAPEGHDMGYRKGYQQGYQLDADNEEAPPPGMEMVKICNGTFLFPKGARITDKSGLVTIEDIDEYIIRRLESVENRLAAIEANEKALSEKIEQLNNRKNNP